MGIKLKICFKTREGNRKTVYARLFVPTVALLASFLDPVSKIVERKDLVSSFAEKLGISEMKHLRYL